VKNINSFNYGINLKLHKQEMLQMVLKASNEGAGHKVYRMFKILLCLHSAFFKILNNSGRSQHISCTQRISKRNAWDCRF